MGAELLRLLCVHPHITLTGVTSDRLAGEALTKAYPHLRGLSELRFHDLDAEWLASVADVVFLALPHMESQKAVPVLRARGRRAIDLSADYRLRDPNDYVTWYKAPHIDLSGLGEAVYGLAERLASGPLKAMRWTKVTTNLPLKTIFHSHFDAGVAYECMSNLSADHQEAVSAFREKRKPVFTGR
jgi:N-acetyl-gamma-glutamylphosphate reductase